MITEDDDDGHRSDPVERRDVGEVLATAGRVGPGLGRDVIVGVAGGVGHRAPGKVPASTAPADRGRPAADGSADALARPPDHVTGEKSSGGLRWTVTAPRDAIPGRSRRNGDGTDGGPAHGGNRATDGQCAPAAPRRARSGGPRRPPPAKSSRLEWDTRCLAPGGGRPGPAPGALCRVERQHGALPAGQGEGADHGRPRALERCRPGSARSRRRGWPDHRRGSRQPRWDVPRCQAHRPLSASRGR